MVVKEIDIVRKFIEENDYTLISEKYVNSKSKLKMICSNNHEIEMHFSNFKSGKRCMKCYRNSQKIQFKDVKKRVEDLGYKLISDTYINGSTPLEIEYV